MKENVDRAENFIGAFGPPFAAQGFFLLDGDIIYAQDNTTKSYALFAKLDWHITDTSEPECRRSLRQGQEEH